MVIGLAVQLIAVHYYGRTHFVSVNDLSNPKDAAIVPVKESEAKMEAVPENGHRREGSDSGSSHYRRCKDYNCAG